MTVIWLLLLLSAGLALTLGILFYLQRARPVSKVLAGLMLASALWSAAYAGELLLAAQNAKIWLAKIQYLAICVLPILLLMLAIEISGRQKHLTPARKISLWTIPILTLVFVWSNELHGWFWRGFDWVDYQGYAILRYQPGSWFWVHTGYNYLLILVATALFAWAAIKLPHLYGRQARLITAAALFPWLGNLIYLLDISPLPGIDLTPLAFILSGILFGLGLHRFRVLSLTPMARDRLVDTMQDAVIVVDAQKRIADLNPAAQHLAGFNLPDALGQPVASVLANWPILALHFQFESAAVTEMRLVSSRQQRWYHSQVNPLRDRQGVVSGWLVVLRDITEQRSAQAEADQLAAVIEQAHETILITDLQGKIKYANPHFEKTTGYAVDEVLEHNPRILKSGVQDAEFYRQLWQKITGGGIWSGELINRRKDGSLYHEAATIFPIRDAYGQIANYAAVKRDITDQVQAQAALQEFSHHLANLHEIGIELALIDSLDQICLRAVELAHKNLGFDRLSIWLMDPDQPNLLYGTYGIDENGHTRDERQQRIEFDGSALPASIWHKTARLHYLENAPLRDQAGKIVGQGEQAIAGLWNGEELIGYISVDNLIHKRPLVNRQRDILIIFGQILENQINRYYSELRLRRTLEQSRLLNEITQTVIEQDDVQVMLQILADRLGELFSADGSYITLWDETHQRTLGGAAYGPLRAIYAQAVQPEPGEPTLTEHVLKTGQPLVVPDALDTPYLSQRLATQFPTRAILALPLVTQQHKLGAALISFNQEHVFTLEDIELGQQAARQISLAVLKTRLLAEARQRAREADTLRQAGAAVATSLELPKTIATILEELNRVVPYDSASVQLMHGNEVEIVGERGFEPRSAMGYRFAINADTPNAMVFEQNQPVILQDARQVFETFRRPPHNHIRAWMGVPLIIQDHIIGMLALDHKEPGRFSDEHARLATAFAAQVAIALENARLFEETQRLAIIDSLTGLFTRRHFMELAHQEFKRSQRYGLPISAIMLDIDDFKTINDTYGHLIGDQVLQLVAAACKQNIRAADLIGRFGGEEFVILLPETFVQANLATENQSRQTSGPETISGFVVAERLRQAAREQVRLENQQFTITISLGIAGCQPETDNVETLIDRADQALLQAKSNGKDQVVIWQEKE
ncbi:MAG: diguanylate cyclase [Anaerolineales bacterium]|nr:diguanylate cyclase [Anaerolineales bacterium]